MCAHTLYEQESATHLNRKVRPNFHHKFLEKQQEEEEQQQEEEEEKEERGGQ